MSAPELDFDELDKAINNVLSDKEVQKEAASMSAPQTAPTRSAVPIRQSQPVSQKLAMPKPAIPSMPALGDRVQGRPSAAPVSDVPARKPVARPVTPAVRRGVIDIMSPPSKRPSRQGATLQPVSDVKAASRSSQAVAPPASQPQTVPPAERALRWPPRAEEPQPESKPTAGQVQQESHQAFETHKATPSQLPAQAEEDSFEQFDQLSRSGFDFADNENQPPAEQVQNTLNAVQEKQKELSASPPASPFLTDAKVEKRPLGGYSTAPVEKLQPEQEEAKQPEVLEGMPTDPLLEEHYDDAPPTIMEPTQIPVTTEAVPENAHTGVKLDHLLDDGSEHEVNVPQASAQNTVPPSATQSIPQQYKVAEQKNEEKPRPIFDTNEYHAPLSEASPVKHQGIGMWVTLVVILLLAVAGGLFIYFYGSQLGL